MIHSGFTGKLLDRYLASGWYRMGTRMFTCRYNFYDWGFLSTVWTRLPLRGEHVFPKGTAKVMRRNARVLRHEVHPARCARAEQRVFVRYRRDKPYDLHESAADYLHMDTDAPFDTWQVSVYDADDTLIAFSYFDRGEDSLQSVCGFYDPAFARHSLGLYTLALEVEAGRRWGMAYHYAGYLVPGNSVFEYKRRVGALECFDDARRRWYPIAELDAAELPDASMRQAMLDFDAVLRGAGVPYGIHLRPDYFISVTQPEMRWIRREQLPFCIVDERSAGRPFWAGHFYSYNYGRYFSLLCTSSQLHPGFGHEVHGFAPSRERERELGRNGLDDLSPPSLASGVGVRVLHESRQPYRLADFERVWEEVGRVNEG